jgi:hypothetical protein
MMQCQIKQIVYIDGVLTKRSELVIENEVGPLMACL